ncbi:hypothetical protein KAU33_15745 [Candidatus Dependentiae bacterium]|nr:hypothetical protein [Candidatus Dependentiae bacterium]
MNYVLRTKSKIENINVVPEPQRTNIRRLVSLADGIFERTGMVGSKEHELFYECVEDQIVQSLMPIKRKEKKYLSIYEYYIRDELRHSIDSELYDTHDIILELYREFLPITKFKKSNYKIGDKVTIGKVIGYERVGYKLITREAKVIEVGKMNMSRPDEISLSVSVPGEIMPRHVIEGKPDHIFWRIV